MLARIVRGLDGRDVDSVAKVVRTDGDGPFVRFVEGGDGVVVVVEYQLGEGLCSMRSVTKSRPQLQYIS